jgi:5-enolpyruvylshikimate-3-phosphate synthase
MKTIPRLERISGQVEIPPSLHHTFGALASAVHTPGSTIVAGGVDNDAVRYSFDALRRLGFEVSGSPATEMVIGDRVGMSATEVELDVGDAAIALRFLAALLSLTPGRAILRGADNVLRENVSDLVDRLRNLGGEIEYAGEEFHPPLQIRGKIVRGQRAVLAESLEIAGFPLHQPSPRIQVPPDQFIASCWRAAAERIGGQLELKGYDGLPEIPPPPPRDDIQSVIAAAIAALATGGSVENDRLVARTVPRFWRGFDAVMASSEVSGGSVR